MVARVLRKVRYLLQRAVRLALLSAWAILLSPLTLSAHLALAAGRPKLASGLAQRAERRNPFTPGLTRLLVRVHIRTGDRTAAARAAAAWARTHHRWDELTYRAWSDHFLDLPGWQPRVDLPAPTRARAGELDLRSLPGLPLGRTAGSGYDALATDLATTLPEPPAEVVVCEGDRAGLAVAAAIAEWCGAEVRVVRR